jgi:hypothetical protein
MQKRILGWLILGSLIGLAMAGALLMVIRPVNLDTGKVGLMLLAAGMGGLLLRFIWTTRRRRRSHAPWR